MSILFSHKRQIGSVGSSNGGFTLVEMIVAVAIFATVVLIAVGALLSIIDANKKANSLRVVMENLNFAVESIARDIRMGNGYSCGGTGDCSQLSTLAFSDQNGESVSYSLSNNALVRTSGGSSITVTSPEVIIQSVRFSVTGSGEGDGVQPRVLITIRGYADAQGRTRSSFSIQTSVSQRDSDS
ncbi:MAG: prepilin-type N-terminal cleavage/methylation domain-containing protein [Candidatus Yonathbacteria bacterium]|nr:prepilin-type N-terminal cleavage/methylation domain-containing protein [Candidatus Yonathbacteria bacterium]